MPVAVVNVSMGPNVLQAFPRGSETFVDVMTAGAEVEAGWAAILASIAGTDGVVATRLLARMRAISAQEAAVLEVASLRQPAEMVTVLKIGAKALRRHRERRNAFAHNLWAVSPEIPDALILLRSEVWITRHAAFIAPVGIPTILDATMSIDEGDIYREGELAAAREEAIQARSVIAHLQWHCMARRLTPGNDGPSLENLRKMASYQAAERAHNRGKGNHNR